MKHLISFATTVAATLSVSYLIKKIYKNHINKNLKRRINKYLNRDILDPEEKERNIKAKGSIYD